MCMEFDYLKFKRIIDERGLKTTWVATSLGVSKDTCRSWLRGARPPRRSAIKHLAILLKIQEQDLMKNTEAS